MIQVIRTSSSRSFRGRPLEPLEARGLLSNLPAITATIPIDTPSPVQVSTTVETEGFTDVVGVSSPPTTFGIGLFTNLSNVQITTQPATSASLTSSPNRIVVTFDQPISTFDLDAFNNDIRLDRINADGTTTPWFNPMDAPRQIANNDGGLGLTFTELTIPLDSPLADGNYQIVLVGGSFVSSDVADGRWNSLLDHVLSTFSVGASQSGGGGQDGSGGTVQQDPVVVAYSSLHPEASVQSFTDLGTLPSGLTSLPENLNPVSGRTPVDLYRFSVAEGHHWRLGIAAQSQDGESGFGTTLTLFKINADGTLQAVSLGNPDAGLSDPQRNGMSYVGLDAGTYCLAVSGTFGTSGTGPLGGRYQLELEATVADQAAEVTGFQLDRVNPSDAAPAGLTIQFSNGIALNGFNAANQATPPLEVVDSQGRVWAVLPLSYQDQTNSLTLVFGNRLPAGNYSLRIGSTNGLTDLAGWTPVAPGLPAGVLATWTVAAETAAPPPSDLGIVWPLATTGVSGSSQLAEDASASFHFTVITPGLYNLQPTIGQGILEVRILTADGQVVLNKLQSNPIASYHVYLPVGSYTLEWTGRSTTPARFGWTLGNSRIDWESLLNNGVGQWSTLNLGFGTTSEGTTQPNNTHNPASTTGGSVADSSLSSVGSSMTVLTQTTVLSQPLLLSPLSSSPIGMPSTANQAISTVGPAVTPGAIAVADNSPGLVGGIRYVGTDHVATGDDVNGQHDESSTVAMIDPRSSTPAPSEVAVLDDPIMTGDRSREADRLVLSSTDWILGIGQRIQDWLEASSLGGDFLPDPDAAAARAASLAEIDRNGEPSLQGDDHDRVEQASLRLPIGVLLTTALLVRTKDPIRRWWKKACRRYANPIAGQNQSSHDNAGTGRHANHPNGTKPTINIIKGPHFNRRTRPVDATGHHSRHRESVHARQK